MGKLRGEGTRLHFGCGCDTQASNIYQFLIPTSRKCINQVFKNCLSVNSLYHNVLYPRFEKNDS